MKLKWWKYVICDFKVIFLIIKHRGVKKALVYKEKERTRRQKELEEFRYKLLDAFEVRINENN